MIWPTSSIWGITYLQIIVSSKDCPIWMQAWIEVLNNTSGGVICGCTSACMARSQVFQPTQESPGLISLKTCLLS